MLIRLKSAFFALSITSTILILLLIISIYNRIRKKLIERCSKLDINYYLMTHHIRYTALRIVRLTI